MIWNSIANWNTLQLINKDELTSSFPDVITA